MQRASVILLTLDNIASIDSNTFKNIPNLQILQLYTSDPNQVFSFKFDLFASSYNLLELYIIGTSITSLNQAMFTSLSQLTDLQIQGNINSIDAKTFVNVRNLISLDLSHNQLSSISPSLFQNMYYLQILDLTSNNLVALDSTQFKGLISLKELGLGSNHLSALPANLFSGLTWLNSLDLSNNSLTQIMGSSFKGCSNNNLLALDLSGNQISTVNVSAFSFANLCDINVRYNQISLTSLTGQSFGSIKNMCAKYSIDLIGNPVLDVLTSKNVDIQSLCGSKKKCFIANTDNGN